MSIRDDLQYPTEYGSHPQGGKWASLIQPVFTLGGRSYVGLVDAEGVLLKTVDGKLRVSSIDYLYDIAEGNVAGHKSWAKIGYNGNIGTIEEDIWTGSAPYVFPAAQMQMQLQSTSGNDDGAPLGTGVQTVTIYYLDNAYAEHEETVTLNGVGAVNTAASNFYRIQNFTASAVGTGGKAAGTITLKDTGAAVTYGQIAIGYTEARNSTWTVPAGQTLYITSVTYSLYNANKGARFTFRATYDHIADALRDFFLPHMEVGMTNGTLHRPLEMPIKFPATTMMKVSAIADQAGAIGSVTMRGWIE
jgi:hypothetical protein